ncbi:general secretion pathway protein GspB [Photobacterium sagamiensis]|uniref:general secretion pathway protein GspB n=1 Tax=Photobacterium sagamiensis TaxID=2910241 RepID=UPI003D0E4A9F
MSNLLNAIELSEQSHSAQSHSAHHQTTSHHSGAAYQPANLGMVSSLKAIRQPRRLPTWLLPALIVALPVAGAIAYTQQMPATQTQSLSPALTPVSVAVIPVERNAMLAAVPVIADKIPGVEFLPYPDLVTEPLAVGDMSYAVTPGHAYDQDSRSYQNEAVTDGGRNGRSSGIVADTASNNTRSDNWELDDLDLSELSPELAQQLKSAIAATDAEPQQEEAETVNESTTSDHVKALAAITIGDLPASVQNRMPKLDFQTHIYSSTANSRWVKVNGREAFEGDELAPGVILRRIDPRQVVFDFESYHIVMPALSEW